MFTSSVSTKDASIDSLKVFTPMPNASHTLSYSLYIKLKNIILLKLKFVVVIVYEPHLDYIYNYALFFSSLQGLNKLSSIKLCNLKYLDIPYL